uniref:Uncharacterized protein n=1 Tax=Anguilla anguilla TaxID=7936 RepID=A0A0E9RZ36_ANGAN
MSWGGGDFHPVAKYLLGLYFHRHLFESSFGAT